jgi:hypothetical protein
MKSPAADDKPIYECGMGPFSLAGLRYEIFHMLAAVLAAAALAGLNYYVTIRFELLDRHPLAPIISMAVMVGIGFMIAYWEMSFFPRRLLVYPDRIRFKMLVSRRDALREEIAGLAALSPAEAQRTYFDYRCANLSPGAEGMVRLDRRRGRAWVFGPEDPEGFLEAANQVLFPAVSGDREDHPQGEVNEPSRQA